MLSHVSGLAGRPKKLSLHCIISQENPNIVLFQEMMVLSDLIILELQNILPRWLFFGLDLVGFLGGAHHGSFSIYISH
jgi:hypothetical protein